MKKIFLVFIVLSTFFLFGCEKNVNIQDEQVNIKKVECDSDMKLWVNKTYNFSMCIPENYLGYDAYGHSILFNKQLKTFTVTDKKGKMYIMNDDISIGELGSNDKIYFGLCSIENKKNINNEYSFKVNGKNICFSFNKNNKEHNKIIKSIKILKIF